MLQLIGYDLQEPTKFYPALHAGVERAGGGVHILNGPVVYGADKSPSAVLKRADWLLRNERGWLALEVSGMAAGDPFVRLKDKKLQVALCSLPAERLAIVVAFARPSIVAGSV